MATKPTLAERLIMRWNGIRGPAENDIRAAARIVEAAAIYKIHLQEACPSVDRMDDPERIAWERELRVLQRKLFDEIDAANKGY